MDSYRAGVDNFFPEELVVAAVFVKDAPVHLEVPPQHETRAEHAGKEQHVEIGVAGKGSGLVWGKNLHINPLTSRRTLVAPFSKISILF